MELAMAIENLKKEHDELHTDIIHVRKMLRKKNKLLQQLYNITKKRQVGPGTWLMLQKRQEESILKKEFFPLHSQKELDEFENIQALDPNLRDDIINEIRSCIKSFGLKRSFHKIINPKLMIFYNMKGTNNMRRLLNYPNFLDILYKAVEESGVTYEDFILEVRKALTVSKVKNPDPNLLST